MPTVILASDRKSHLLDPIIKGRKLFKVEYASECRLYKLAGSFSNAKQHLPYASTKTVIVRAITVELVIPKSAAIARLAGAIIEDETGEMNVKAETMAVAAHFRLKVQLKKTEKKLANGHHVRYITTTYFLGFWGSSGPSQSTIQTSLFSS